MVAALGGVVTNLPARRTVELEARPTTTAVVPARVDVHHHHHTELEPSRPLMVFAAWLVAIGLFAVTAPVYGFVFALVTFALLVVVNQTGWRWARRQ